MLRRHAPLVPLALCALYAAAFTACAARPVSQDGRPTPPRGELTTADATSFYRSAGLMASVGAVSFVGTLAHFATAAPDTTLALLTLSLPTNTLAFTREGTHFRAAYSVHAALRRGSDVPRDVDATEVVRVGTQHETVRSEESVIFQQFIRLVPGTYTVSVVVRDESSMRSGSSESSLTIPSIAPRGLSSALPVFEADARSALDSTPHLVASPRSTAVFGRDSMLAIYVEAYQPQPGEWLRVAVRGDGSTIVWKDSLAIPESGVPVSGFTFQVPLSPIGIGLASMTLSRSATGDTVRAPLFVSFGDDLPVASFNEMLTYLRFYASAERIKALRDAAPDQRGAAWATFLRETDSTPSTPQHEGLATYFGRIRIANERYRQMGSGPGWLSDRGTVYVALGDADQVLEPTPSQFNQRNITLIWEYQRFHLQLVFVDRTGIGNWELTSESEAEFLTIMRRELVR